MAGQQTPTETASRTLTFLFTDVEGSTQLWEHHQHAMKDALERHDSILRGAIQGTRGQVVKTIGDGFMAVFDSAVDGVCATPGRPAGPRRRARGARPARSASGWGCTPARRPSGTTTTSARP